MTDAPIYLETRDEIAVLVINRPEKRNALNRAAWEAIHRLVRDVAADRRIKVLLLRGATPEAFASGADIGEFAEVYATADSARHYHEALVRPTFEAVATLEKPTIALIQGICFGGGCTLALTCDLRYADTSARFSIPPAKLGLVYSLRDSKGLVDLVGPSKAKEMLFSGRVVEAREAIENGLITRLFQPADLDRETFALAEELCRLSQYSIRAIKRIVGSITGGATDDNELTRGLLLGAFGNPDYQEGRDAFLEKRPPRFTHR